MENKNKLGNAAEDATQAENVQKYRNQMIQLAELLEQNEHALNKFADLYREDFGDLLKDITSVRTMELIVDGEKEETAVHLSLKYKNRFYALQSILNWFYLYVRNEGGKANV
jgi:hypothetical protein